jgi:hypothetical protein
MRNIFLLASVAWTFAATATSSTSQESPLVKAAKQRIEEINSDRSKPAFEFTYLCDQRLAVIHPKDHDLKLFLPTQSGASTDTVHLQDAFAPVFEWLDQDYMQPTQLLAAAASGKSKKVEAPLVFLIVERLDHRLHFNVRYSDGVLLDDMLMHYLLPLGHEDCLGVPCAYPGSCADITSCQWEIHVPVCEFVNRGTAELLQRKYGALPPAILGLAEIVEVGVTGGHYAYRHWGNQSPILPHSERNGYADEFGSVLKKRYAKKKEREPFLLELIGWKGGYFSTNKYAASWGLGQTLLGHLKETGRGAKKRNLGDLLLAIGQLEKASPQAVLDEILKFDPKFESTFKKKISTKYSKNLHRLLFD